jgi:hypothetical protein
VVVCWAFKTASLGVAAMLAMLFGIAWNLGEARGRRRRK